MVVGWSAMIDFNKEAVLGLMYFAGYMGYLFVNPEGELMHWVMLVCLPLIALYLFQKKTLPTSSLKITLSSVGLERNNLKSGVPWAIGLGLTLSCLQLFVSQQRDAIWQIFKSGKVFYLFPLTFLLMLLMAGVTEEFFFRGVLQTRLARLLRSNFRAVVLTSILFGFYHLPYAYLNPRWPSHGDWVAAITSAFTQGGVGGLILGTVYVRARFNLLACVLVHSLINVLPGMTMIKFGGP
jgi:membrane protease YdiL (CAAX protease family)